MIRIRARGICWFRWIYMRLNGIYRWNVDYIRIYGGIRIYRWRGRCGVGRVRMVIV